MQALQSPASPTESANRGVSPGWQIGYSAFGLFGLIVLGAFGTLFAICLMRAKQRYAIGDYVPNSYDDWERAYRLTRPPLVEGAAREFLLLFWGQTKAIQYQCPPRGGRPFACAAGATEGPVAPIAPVAPCVAAPVAPAAPAALALWQLGLWGWGAKEDNTMV
ncbi:hypothetical protein AFLA70_192g002211 [Aspergillus flavus AF70]|nr:hypothetical protein AFLA70_192g002211 [Aspergillus flavus AF70]